MNFEKLLLKGMVNPAATLRSAAAETLELAMRATVASAASKLLKKHDVSNEEGLLAFESEFNGFFYAFIARHDVTDGDEVLARMRQGEVPPFQEPSAPLRPVSGPTAFDRALDDREFLNQLKRALNDHQFVKHVLRQKKRVLLDIVDLKDVTDDNEPSRTRFEVTVKTWAFGSNSSTFERGRGFVEQQRFDVVIRIGHGKGGVATVDLPSVRLMELDGSRVLSGGREPFSVPLRTYLTASQ